MNRFTANQLYGRAALEERRETEARFEELLLNHRLAKEPITMDNVKIRNSEDVHKLTLRHREVARQMEQILSAFKAGEKAINEKHENIMKELPIEIRKASAKAMESKRNHEILELRKQTADARKKLHVESSQIAEAISKAGSLLADPIAIARTKHAKSENVLLSGSAWFAPHANHWMNCGDHE